METQLDGALGQQTEAYSEADKAILEGQDKPENQEDLIGGKFKTPDELLQAYQELEKKLGERPIGYDGKQEEESEQEEPTTNIEEQPLSQDEESTLLESVGGQDNLQVVSEWARDNLDQKEIDDYNKEVNSGDFVRARNALQSLVYAFQSEVGTEPDLLGGTISNNSTDVYRSTNEVVAAMDDPRYLNDPAYTKDVEEKLSRSNVLSPS